MLNAKIETVSEQGIVHVDTENYSDLDMEANTLMSIRKIKVQKVLKSKS